MTQFQFPRMSIIVNGYKVGIKFCKLCVNCENTMLLNVIRYAKYAVITGMFSDQDLCID